MLFIWVNTDFQYMLNSKMVFETSFIRKYYNPLATFDHRRIWPQKENLKRELQ